MARHDVEGASVEPRREDFASASISITPIPIDEIDLDDAIGRRDIPSQQQATSVATEPSPLRRRKPRPSRHVAKYLFGSERYVGEWRRHWIHVVWWSVLGVASPFVAGYLIGILGPRNPMAVWIILGVWLAGLAVIAWLVFDWWIERFVLTNKRVMLITGVLTRKVAMMPLARVTDMAYVQSPLGMALNYGTFVIESAGQDQALREVKPLPHPNELYLLFCQEMYDPDAVAVEAEANSPEGDHQDH